MSSSEDISVKDAPERERRDEESGAKHVSGYLMMVYMPENRLRLFVCNNVGSVL